jgi:hypothetical protein
MGSIFFWGVAPSLDLVPESDAFLTLSNRYMDATIPALRSQPEGEAFLEQLYKALATPDILLNHKRDRLSEILQADLVPESLLEHRAANVGFDVLTPWITSLPVLSQRRLAKLGVVLWRQKGVTLRQFVRLLTGGKVVELDWHAMRYVVGYPLPEIVIGSPYAGSAENTVFIHNTNPEGIDAEVLNAALDTMRPVRGVIMRQQYIFIDGFTEGLGQWQTTDGLSIPEDGQLLCDPDPAAGWCVAQPIVDASAWTAYELHVRGNYKLANAVYVRVLQDAVTEHGYEVRIAPAGAGSVLGLYDSNGGALLASSALFSLFPAYIYSLRVSVRVLGSGAVNVRVVLDGNELIDHVDLGATYTAGGFSVRVAPALEFTARRIEVRSVV